MASNMEDIRERRKMMRRNRERNMMDKKISVRRKSYRKEG